MTERALAIISRSEPAMRSIVAVLARFARRLRRLAERPLHRMIAARRLRHLQELEFRRSLDRYRRSVGLPALHDDDPILF